MRDNPEQRLQIAVVEFLRFAAPDLMFWFCPNGGNLSKTQAGIFRRMGLRAGVPDLHFLVPSGVLGMWVPAFIELKAGRGSLSGEQDAFRVWCKNNAVRWAECRSVEDVEHALTEWGVKLRASVLPSGVFKRTG